jgi:predicted Zn-dependent peptidase
VINKNLNNTFTISQNQKHSPQVRVLENGMVVVSQRLDYFKSVAIGLVVSCGVRDELGNPTGISHFIEHILFRGTKYHNTEELAEIIEDLGGHVDASTGREDTTFYVHTANEYVLEGLDFLFDLVNCPNFTSKGLQQEKRVILEEIKESSDQPEELLLDNLDNKIWKKHPMGGFILGTPGNLRRITVDNLNAFHNRFYTGRRMILGIAGDFDEDAVFRKINKDWGSLPKGEEIERTVPITYPEGSYIISRSDLTQNHVAIAFEAFSAVDSRRIPLALVYNYLGGGMNSLFYRVLREKLGLVYTINAFSNLKSDTGYWVIHFSTGKEKTKQALTALKDIIKGFKQKGFDKESLSKIKRQYRLNLALSIESLPSQLGFLLKNQILWGKQIPLDRILNEIDEVDLDRINLLLPYLIPDKAIQIIVGEGKYEEFSLT